MEKGSKRARAERRRHEAAVKARIQKLIREGQGFLTGALSERMRVCGRPTCKCVTQGIRHEGLYLVQRREGKLRQLFIPESWSNDVRQWVVNRQVLEALLEELSAIWWENIQAREI
jgi:hypothetical protein